MFHAAIKKGFSIIEVIIVILLLSILIGVSMPIYFDLVEKAKESKENYVVGAVKTGLQMEQLKQQLQ